MRRRRKHLEVSTFPFLAVLLCAMGALILVLLIMDRKAHRVAEAKALDRVRQQHAEYDRQLAQRRLQHEGKKRVVRQAWEKKREVLRTRVHTEEEALDRELRQVRARLAEAARKLQRAGLIRYGLGKAATLGFSNFPDLTLFRAMTPDGQRLISRDKDNQMTRWRLEDTKIVREESVKRSFRTWVGIVPPVAFSPDSKRLIHPINNKSGPKVDKALAPP